MTIQKLAEECGVSASTVSRALNGDPNVNETVRERIMAAAVNSGYCKSDRRHKKKKSGKRYIAVIACTARNYFYSEILGRIEDCLRNTDYSTGFLRLDNGEDEIEKAVSLMQEDRLAGIIFLGGRFDYTPSEIAVINVPFVMCAYTNRFGSLPPKLFSSVYCDDYMIGYNTAKTLIDAGHKKIGAIFTSKNDRSASELHYQGFCAALSDSGIELEDKYIVETKNNSIETGCAGANTLLNRGLDMTAVFADSDAMAFGALKAIDDRGFRVPEDISVIGIDGLTFSKYLIPTLMTTVRPAQELAEISVKLLVELIEGGENRQICLPSYLRRGESVKKLI